MGSGAAKVSSRTCVSMPAGRALVRRLYLLAHDLVQNRRFEAPRRGQNSTSQSVQVTTVSLRRDPRCRPAAAAEAAASVGEGGVRDLRRASVAFWVWRLARNA